MFRRLQIVVLVSLWASSVAFAQGQRDPCVGSGYVTAYWKGCLLERGKLAEQNGKQREAWEWYMRALREGPKLARGVDQRTGRAWNYEQDIRTDQEVIGRLIALRNRMQPRPQIPSEAHAAMQRGIAAIDNATSPKDFADAEGAFEEAVKLAPWWPDALLNLAYTRETLGAYFDAIQSFRLYLLAAPDADDSNKVRAKIDELERKR